MKKKTLNYIYTGLVFLILCVSFVVIFSSLNNILTVKVLSVSSGSMWPAVPTGSAIIVVPRNQYSKEDIITFRKEGKEPSYITHRIVESVISGERKYFVTKGDANENADLDMVAGGDIVGKVLLVIPFVGYFASYAKTPLGILLVIFLPSAVIVCLELTNIWKEVKSIKARDRRKNSFRW